MRLLFGSETNKKRTLTLRRFSNSYPETDPPVANQSTRRYDGGNEMTSKQNRWRAIAKWLRIVGVSCCFTFFLTQAALLVYYSASRPDVPQLEQLRTVRLSWTHPVRYGTERDESRLQLVFELGFYSFGVFAAGEFIKIYKLHDYSGLRNRPNLPWNHRWGP